MSITPTRVMLREAFRLIYLEGVANVEDIALELNLPFFKAKQLIQSLEKHLRAKIHVLTPDRLQFVCPECLEARVYADPITGEYVCGNCGFVLENVEYSTSLPFDTTYALTSELAYGKSLGSTLNRKAIMRVLARSPATVNLANEGNSHLGLRAQIAKIITQTVDPPALRAALDKVTKFSSQYGLSTDYIFNDDVAILVKQAFWFADKIAVDNSFKRKLAETCFWLALTLHGKTALAQKFREDHKINHSLHLALKDLENFIYSVKYRGRLLSRATEMFALEEIEA